MGMADRPAGRGGGPPGRTGARAGRPRPARRRNGAAHFQCAAGRRHGRDGRPARSLRPPDPRCRGDDPRGVRDPCRLHARLYRRRDAGRGRRAARRRLLFKPAFNRHLLRAVDYFGDLVALRTAHARAIGGARAYLPLAWRYDLLLRAAGALPPEAIRHIPRVAFGRRGAGGWTGFASADQAREAARALEDATGAPVEIRADLKLRPHYRLPDVPPLVSFVIPTRDRADLMGMALRSLIAHTAYRNFEIVIVDNGSVEPETFALFAEIQAAWPRTIVVRDDGGFNYPRICNAGVDVASGELICLLNNDIEVVDPGWLHEMVSLAALPGTGIVGAKLLFPDRTLQHAGVIAGLFRYAAHWFSHGAEDMAGHLGRLQARNNLSAVTGACLMISRACWDQIGPLDAERFAEDCNDIDLCLRARAGGFELGPAGAHGSALAHREPGGPAL
ncbi:MAG: hypothetical protein B7Z45_05430 [Azorhizobium sp. 12-66-6]|nr:MAG: hypothetical protein B7Z45_05430 [Azorhizobium sp. 12-66-6]